MSNVTWTIVIIVCVLVVAALVLGGIATARRRRSQRLRERFGPEYDRAVERSDDRRQAEADLRAREKRHDDLELQPLDAQRRDHFQHRWTAVQGEFVDDPKRAVLDADQLVAEVMSARGYPVKDFEQRADDLSVRYPQITQHYREARRITESNERGEARTEDLRRAVTSYRSLVDALLGDKPEADTHSDERDRHEH